MCYVIKVKRFAKSHVGNLITFVTFESGYSRVREIERVLFLIRRLQFEASSLHAGTMRWLYVYPV